MPSISSDKTSPKNRRFAMDMTALRNIHARQSERFFRTPPFQQTHVRPISAAPKIIDGARRKPSARSLSDLTRFISKNSLRRFLRRSEIYARRTRRIVSRFIPDFAPRRILAVSLVGGVVFGVLSMALIEHFFGPGVFARSDTAFQTQPAPATLVPPSPSDKNIPTDTLTTADSALIFDYFNQAEQEQYEQNIREMVAGYPIEPMLPYIFEKDRLTTAFLIGIAKKESNWGKRVPVLADQDCFNYWGYRGIRRMMGTGGHTCFNSRKDAVDTVAKRLSTLIHSQNLDTPEKMVIWKCGFSCAGQNRTDVLKWISDVDMYFEQAGDE